MISCIDEDDGDNDVFLSKPPLPATSKRKWGSAVGNIWDTTMMPFMQNAKNSSGRVVSEMETVFLTWSSATALALGFMVSTTSGSGHIKPSLFSVSFLGVKRHVVLLRSRWGRWRGRARHSYWSVDTQIYSENQSLMLSAFNQLASPHSLLQQSSVELCSASFSWLFSSLWSFWRCSQSKSTFFLYEKLQLC